MLISCGVRIDQGETGEKVDFSDPAAAPLGTDGEAAGAPVTARELAMDAGSAAKAAQSAGTHRGDGAALRRLYRVDRGAGPCLRRDPRLVAASSMSAAGISVANAARFPTAAGLLFGLGLGGFFDGIVLHQILQWHHMMTSAGYPPSQRRQPRVQHFPRRPVSRRHICVHRGGPAPIVAGAQQGQLLWSGKMLAGTLLMGFGIFNVVEGLVDHQLLGIHHVNETVPREQWIFWDLGFLVWGAAMILGGWGLYRGGSGQHSRP